MLLESIWTCSVWVVLAIENLIKSWSVHQTTALVFLCLSAPDSRNNKGMFSSVECEMSQIFNKKVQVLKCKSWNLFLMTRRNVLCACKPMRADLLQFQMEHMAVWLLPEYHHCFRSRLSLSLCESWGKISSYPCSVIGLLFFVVSDWW